MNRGVTVKKIMRAALTAASVVALIAAVCAPSAAYSASKSFNGCTATIYGKTVQDAATDIDYSYSATWRTNSVGCSLATYNKYKNFGGTTVYTTSTDWDALYAEKTAPVDTFYVSSAHYVNYNGPLAGRWYTLP